MAVSTLSSNVTIHERMYSEPLNGIPTSSMTADGGTAEGECPDLYSVVYNYDSGHNIKAYLLLCTAIVVSFLSVKMMFSSGIEMVTLQVYTPPCDDSSGEKVSVPLSDTTEPDEFSHCTVGDLVRIAGTSKLHSTEKGWPAVELRSASSTVGLISSARRQRRILLRSAVYHHLS